MNTKEHILNVSFDLFLQKSFNEVTLKNISENTGMSKGAIYYYFETKEQIFLEIVNNIFSVVESHYNKISKDSLYQFYHDYVTFFIKSTFNNRNDDEVNINLNYFSLIFIGVALASSEVASNDEKGITRGTLEFFAVFADRIIGSAAMGHVMGRKFFSGRFHDVLQYDHWD